MVQSATTLDVAAVTWENGETEHLLMDSQVILVNRMPLDWSTKRQNNVDTATADQYAPLLNEANHHIVMIDDVVDDVPLAIVGATSHTQSLISNWMLYHVWKDYYSSNNSGDNCNNNSDSDSKHKTNDKIWYAEHDMAHEGQSRVLLEWLYWESFFDSHSFLVALFGFIMIVLSQLRASTLVPPINPTVDSFMSLDAQHMHTNNVPAVVKSSSYCMNYYRPRAKLVKVRSFKRLAKIAMMVHRASSVSTSLQEGDNGSSNDHYKNQVVIPVVSADCTSEYYMFTGSNDNIQQHSFVCNKNCPVHLYCPKAMHQHLLLSPAYIITTSNMTVMHRGLFTGRPPGFALAMIGQFVIWQIIINNKSALEQHNIMTQRQEDEDYYVIYLAILETKSHQVVLLNIKIHLVVRKETWQCNSYFSSERGVTTFEKEFEFEFTFEFELLSHVGLLVSPCAHKHVSTRIRIKIYCKLPKGRRNWLWRRDCIYIPQDVYSYDQVVVDYTRFEKDYVQIIAYYARRMFTYVIGKYERFEDSALVKNVQHW
jgi:hypothetical protein